MVFMNEFHNQSGSSLLTPASHQWAIGHECFVVVCNRLVGHAVFGIG